MWAVKSWLKFFAYIALFLGWIFFALANWDEPLFDPSLKAGWVILLLGIWAWAAHERRNQSREHIKNLERNISFLQDQIHEIRTTYHYRITAVPKQTPGVVSER